MVFLPTVHVPLHSGSQSFSPGRSSVPPCALQPLKDSALPPLLTILCTAEVHPFAQKFFGANISFTDVSLLTGN